MSGQTDPVVGLHEVYKSYPVGGEQVEVLKGISFDVCAGEFLAIVGASGNGKSTLLNMITGIDHPTRGEVRVAGSLITALNEGQLARWRGQYVGIVFQFFQLLPALSLLQNVILPMDLVKTLRPKERRARALALLERVGLADQVDKLPSMVSGGQQQRAAIARALANDPPLVVADEPTGNLDSRTSGDIFDLFTDLVEQGKTVIIVTHDEDLACSVPRTLEIANGLIVRDETCSDAEGGALFRAMDPPRGRRYGRGAGESGASGGGGV
jgi:putative ABC transport system ATP-binding protein